MRVSKAINDDGEPRGWTKTGLNRNVEITRDLAEELRSHVMTVRSYFEKRKRPVPTMLFPSLTGAYLEVRNVRRLFKEICTRAGIRGFTMYDLRHTYASLMLMRGADPRYVQQQLGHESVSTTYRYYSHWIPKEARASYADLIELRETITEGSREAIPCTNSVSNAAISPTIESIKSLE